MTTNYFPSRIVKAHYLNPNWSINSNIIWIFESRNSERKVIRLNGLIKLLFKATRFNLPPDITTQIYFLIGCILSERNHTEKALEQRKLS